LRPGYGLGCQARFPNTGLAAEDDRLALAVSGQRKQPLKRRQLQVAADHNRAHGQAMPGQIRHALTLAYSKGAGART
jgi:hypothetical protein